MKAMPPKIPPTIGMETLDPDEVVVAAVIDCAPTEDVASVAELDVVVALAPELMSSLAEVGPVESSLCAANAEVLDVEDVVFAAVVSVEDVGATITGVFETEV